MTKTLLRYTLDISNIEEINISILAYEKMISFYHSWKEKNGEYEVHRPLRKPLASGIRVK